MLRRSKRARWATKPRVALLLVFSVASFGLGLYALAANLPAPTITSGPANPTNQTSASFTYTDSKPITRFECQLDGSGFALCGTTRPHTKNYPGPLSEGSHLFQVRAVSGSQTSAITSYPWVIDIHSPYVMSITRTGPTPTNASSVAWAVQFSEPVTGVDALDFQLLSTGLLLAHITSVSGSGAAYTVAASTGIGSPGTLRLNLVDNDSIRDPAGNRLGGIGAGNGNVTGPLYAIDKIRPPEPYFTQTPPNPSPSGSSTFAWGDAESPNVTFQCSKENGAWFACTSPYSYTVVTTANGQHQFAVRAIDLAGNISSPGSYAWKVSQVGFTIAGNATGVLYLGVWRSIAVAITNPNNFKIYVNSVTVGVPTSPAGCSASTNIEFIQSPISTSHTLMVPAHATVTLAGTDRPQIRLKNLPTTNQDACKGKTFHLAYAGMATN